jgi:hypothetical protein
MKDSISRQSNTRPRTFQSEAFGISASGQLLPVSTGYFGSISVSRDRQESPDCVEKVDTAWLPMH